MDWSEIIRSMVVLAGTENITFAEFDDLIPPNASFEDIERLLDALNAKGIWVAGQDAEKD